MIVNTVFLVAIFALTIYGVFHGEDLGAMMEAMRRADVRWLLPGLLCVVFFIWGESIIIWYMMHSFQIPVKRRTCFLFSSVGFFFSCITPSASGGQPMQLYYMKKEKISLPVSTVILMIVTITYKAVLVVVGLGLVLFGQGFLHRYLTEILPVFYLGIGLNVFCVTAMLILVFHPALARTILVFGLKIVEKLHLMKRKESRLKKLEASMEVYQNTAVYLGTHKMVLVNVLAITAFDETKRKPPEKTGSFHGSLPEYGSVSWHPQNGAGQCPCDYLCTEVCFICSNMVCIPRLPFIRHFLYHHCAAAGGHFRIG